jgi:hypothetical protein
MKHVHQKLKNRVIKTIKAMVVGMVMEEVMVIVIFVIVVIDLLFFFD